jgi:hypothetical protein
MKIVILILRIRYFEIGGYIQLNLTINNVKGINIGYILIMASTPI